MAKLMTDPKEIADLFGHQIIYFKSDNIRKDGSKQYVIGQVFFVPPAICQSITYQGRVADAFREVVKNVANQQDVEIGQPVIDRELELQRGYGLRILPTNLVDLKSAKMFAQGIENYQP